MPKSDRPLRVFISHSSKDQSIARALHFQLNAAGWMELWFIESSLKPSQNWDAEIRTATESADVVIALISKNSFKREAYLYPAPNFVCDILQSKPRKNVLVIPLRLDAVNLPANVAEREAFDYFPKTRRKLIDSQLIQRLKIYADQNGFSMERQVHILEPEQRLVWSPTRWREQDEVFDEETTEEEPRKIKPTRWSSATRKRISSGLNRLLYVSLTILILLVFLAMALAVNFINTGETVNDLAAPVISRVLTLAPLPTPTLGVDSTRVSSVDGMRMVYIPAGEFIMGSDDGPEDERPARSVYLDSYWTDQFEVTNGMYKVCVDNGKCNPPDYRSANEWFHLELIPFLEPVIRFYDEPKFESYPISRITWDDANNYCTWVGRRLPTEAEWEKAARGTDGRTYPWGEDVDCTHANVYAFPADDACAYAPARVGSYENGVSPFGVYDMAGNVFEFVSDDYEYFFKSEDNVPLGFSIILRLRKGGSWITSGQVARSANRELWNPAFENIDPNSLEFFDPEGENGFRCAVSGDAPTPQTVHKPAPTREIIAQVSPIDEMPMIYVSAGEFIMGSYYSEEDEQPAHRVYLDAFWIDQYEVTNQQYAMCVNDNKCSMPFWNVRGGHLFDEEYTNHPVILVSKSNAYSYCLWAGRRLPTEAEWEKAARGEIGHTYPWGEKNPFDQLLNFNRFIGDTTPVGSYEDGISPYGAYDMAGNVYEWVSDRYDEAYYKNSPYKNPSGPDSGNLDVLRGGSWGNDGGAVRSSNRYAPLAMQNLPLFIGFRCALSE